MTVTRIRRRQWARWVQAFNYDLQTAVELARDAGLLVVTAYRSNMSCWHHLVVYGTREQVATASDAWFNHGPGRFPSMVARHKPRAGAPLETNAARSEWLDSGCMKDEGLDPLVPGSLDPLIPEQL